MKETILLYNILNTPTGDAIEKIVNQLGIRIISINRDDINHSIGYLLGEDGFEPSTNKENKVIPEEKMMIIYDFSDKQVELMLQIFKEANIEYIPLKAVVTPTNIEWSFVYLYEHVKEEYEAISSMRG